MFPPGIKPQTFYWYSVEVLEEAKKYSIKYVGKQKHFKSVFKFSSCNDLNVH